MTVTHLYQITIMTSNYRYCDRRVHLYCQPRLDLSPQDKTCTPLQTSMITPLEQYLKATEGFSIKLHEASTLLHPRRDSSSKRTLKKI